MRLLYTMAGAAWGLAAGAVTAGVVFGLGFAVAWLFLFGDDPWPEGTTDVIGLVAGLAGLLAFAALTAAGYLLGRQAQAGMVPGGRRTGWLALAGGVAACLGLAAFVLLRERQDDQQRRDLAKAQAAVEALLAERHRPMEVAITPMGDAVSVEVATRGERSGTYRLQWSVGAAGLRGAAEGEMTAALPAGAGRLGFAADMAPLLAAWRAADPETALADTFLEVRVALAPVPAGVEADAVERAGRLDLAATARATAPVRIDLRRAALLPAP